MKVLLKGIGLLLLINMSSCTPNATPETHKDNKAPFGWSKRCVEGHTYYYHSGTNWEASMAPKLDDNGHPIKCKNIEK